MAVPATQRAAGLSPVSSPGLPWTVLDLPTPPSVNRFMRHLGNKSPVVVQWTRQADAQLMRAGRYTKLQCPFEAEFTFKRDRSDWHNRLKCLFDWLQRVELIRNDRDCERMTAGWGDAPLGVRVKLMPFMED